MSHKVLGKESRGRSGKWQFGEKTFLEPTRLLPYNSDSFDRFGPAQAPWIAETTERNPMERTLVLLKPDCVQRRLIGQLISRFENKGYAVIAMKMLQLTPELARQHYAEHVGKPFYPGLESYITSGPLVAMVVEGREAIRVVREMVGATSGLKATPGTIRGDYGTSRQMNLVHASDGPEAARREIEIYFRPEELCDYALSLAPWMSAADEE